MILERNIDLKIGNSGQINYFRKKGGEYKIGDIIKIDVSLLPNGSHTIINVKCDICDCIKNMMYGKYYKLTNGLKEKYYCIHCNNIKTKKLN